MKEHKLKLVCREKHVYSYSPSDSMDVIQIVGKLQEYYGKEGYNIKVDLSTGAISFTATRIIGVEEGEQNE